MRYELDRLGWLQFEELCQALLKNTIGLGLEAWGGTGDHGRDAFFPGPLAFPAANRVRPGPFVFQVKFVENANAAAARPLEPLERAVASECSRIRSRRANVGAG
jgi:hypothetical protein